MRRPLEVARGLRSFLVAIGAACAADSDLSPLSLVRMMLAVVDCVRCARSALSSPSGDDQPSLSDTIRRMTIHFKDAANLEVRDGGLDFDYATGEDVEGATPPRYAELMHFQNLTARLREFGAGFDGEIVPSGISARHKRHLATVVIRQYQTLCDDLTALVGRCRNQTGGADVAFALRESENTRSQGYDAVFTDGGKVLTAYSGSFADAAKWADATTLIEPVRAHFVPPDDGAAYQAHKTARETAHRNAACDAMEAALVEMKASYGAWTLWPPE